jgi:hypothetical protein
MASPNQILGRVKITVAGTVVSSKPGAKFTPSSVERESVVDDNGYAGFTEKPIAPSVEFEVFIKGKITAAQLMAIVDDTCLFEGDNGYTATLTLATMATPGTVTVASGGSTFQCKMFGGTVNETSPS